MNWWLLEKPFGSIVSSHTLTAEAVQSASLALQSIDNVHGGHCLPLGVLCVGDCVPDDVLQEHLEDTAGLLVDETADTLHSTPAGETANGRLGDTLDVVTKNLPVTLGSSFAKSLASFAASSHLERSRLLEIA